MYYESNHHPWKHFQNLLDFAMVNHWQSFQILLHYYTFLNSCKSFVKYVEVVKVVDNHKILDQILNLYRLDMLEVLYRKYRCYDLLWGDRIWNMNFLCYVVITYKNPGKHKYCKRFLLEYLSTVLSNANHDLFAVKFLITDGYA